MNDAGLDMLKKIRNDILHYRANSDFELHAKTWLDNCEFLLNRLEPYLRGEITEQMLRDHKGYLHVGHGCEVAIRGTTEKLHKAIEQIGQLLLVENQAKSHGVIR